MVNPGPRAGGCQASSAPAHIGEAMGLCGGMAHSAHVGAVSCDTGTPGAECLLADLKHQPAQVQLYNAELERLVAERRDEIYKLPKSGRTTSMRAYLKSS